MKLLLRRDSTRGHTKATLFAGEPDKTMMNCGLLTMLPQEYAVLKSALLLAAAQPMWPHEVEIREDGE